MTNPAQRVGATAAQCWAILNSWHMTERGSHVLGEWHKSPSGYVWVVCKECQGFGCIGLDGKYLGCLWHRACAQIRVDSERGLWPSNRAPHS